MHPYLEELHERTERNESGEWINKYEGTRWLRRQLVERYAWAIPSEEILDLLAELSPVVELGAGNGYWSWLIERHGGTSIPVDPSPGDEEWCDVTVGTHRDVGERWEADTMLLCWPSFGCDWPAEAVREFDGDTLVYVGEGRGGHTGTHALHTAIADEFGLADEVIDIPQWECADDRAYVFSC